MASAIWYAKVIAFIDCLSEGNTINEEYYSSSVSWLRKAPEIKLSGELAKGNLFQKDNDPE